jgi:hypothetical protein
MSMSLWSGCHSFDNRHELPTVDESAILYEVDLLTTVLTVHVLRTPSAYETADAHRFLA